MPLQFKMFNVKLGPQEHVLKSYVLILLVQPTWQIANLFKVFAITMELNVQLY